MAVGLGGGLWLLGMCGAVRAGRWGRHAVFFCLVGKWSPEDRGVRKMSGRTTLMTRDQGVKLEMVSRVVRCVSQVRKKGYI